MAAVNFTQGIKCAGDRLSAVASFGLPIQSMSFDDNTAAFVNTDTKTSQAGASPHFQGNSLDSVPTGGAAATPYVTSHVCTLTLAQYNTFVVKRIALHNGAGTPPSATAPTDSTTTIMFGLDGLSLTKQATFSLVPTFKLSLT